MHIANEDYRADKDTRRNRTKLSLVSKQDSIDDELIELLLTWKTRSGAYQAVLTRFQHD